MSHDKSSEADSPLGINPQEHKMSSSESSNKAELPNRRTFLAGAAGVLGMLAVSSCSWQEFVQDNFQRMTKEEIEQTVDRLRKEYKEKYGKDFVVGTEGPIDHTLFGYALDIQRCIGCRKCVYACVEENNQSRDPQIQYIRVLRFKDGDMDIRTCHNLLRSGRSSSGRLLLYAGAMPALRKRSLHQGLSGQSHLDRA